MSSLPFILAVLYLCAGAFWWRRIVLPGPALCSPEEWRVDLAEAAACRNLAFLIVKATFVLLWPLALILGFVWARIG